MIKKILSIVALSLVFAIGVTMAQAPEVTRSTGFKEPSAGACRLLQIRNGNTMLFHFTKKKGIEVSVFDMAHKMLPAVENHVESFTASRLSTSGFEGLFDINGQGVLFLRHYAYGIPLLYRLVFDSNSGKLVEEKVITEYDGKIRIGNYHVSKDPESDYYAVATSYRIPGEVLERMKVTHYSPEHHVINEGYYTTTNEKLPWLHFFDMYVHGEEYVLLSSLGYNIEKSSREEPRTFISRLSKRSPEIESVGMGVCKSSDIPVVGWKYNPVNKQLYMLSGVNAKSVGMEPTMNSSEGKMVLKMNIINPATLQASQDNYIQYPGLTAYAQQKLRYKHSFTGVIQDFRLHEDGSTTVMFEELEWKRSTSTSTSAGGGVSFTTDSWAKLGDIGVVHIGPDGKELPGSYALAKSQYTQDLLFPFYLYKRATTDWNYNRGAFKGGANNNNFFSFDYLYANGRPYTIYNDYVENVKRKEENYRRRKGMRTVSKANTILAWFDGEKIQRSYLFGDPGKKDIARYCRLDLNTHNADGKSFATMMIERIRRKKQTYIVWVKLP